jgi:hypothetical protein
MKWLIGLILFLVSFIVFVVLYFNYDKKGYLYGYGCKFCIEKLPFGLEPKFNPEYPPTFYLLDEDKFELIGNGFRFYSSSFKIKGLLAYGFNDTSVIVKCTDSLNIIKYLTSYITEYKSKKGNPTISFKDLDDRYFEQVKNKYKWVEIDEEKINTIWIKKLILIGGSLLSLFFLIRKLLQLKKSRVLR